MSYPHYSQSMPNLQLANVKLQRPPLPSLNPPTNDHSRQPSDSTFNLIDYYAEMSSYQNTEHSDTDHSRLSDSDSDEEEPFTFINASSEQDHGVQAISSVINTDSLQQQVNGNSKNVQLFNHNHTHIQMMNANSSQPNFHNHTHHRIHTPNNPNLTKIQTQAPNHQKYIPNPNFNKPQTPSNTPSSKTEFDESTASLAKSTKSLPNKPKSNPITKTESFASLQKTRTSVEIIRNIIGESIDTKEGQQHNNNNSKFTTKKSIINSERDRYGFKKTNHFINRENYDDWWSDYSKYSIRRKKKWVKFMIKNGLYNESALETGRDFTPVRFPARSEDLKRFVRKGIPSEWRGNAWFYFAKGNVRLNENKGVYDKLVAQTMDMINENTEAIEKDLHRTFPENIHFNDTGENEESALLGTLRRVLKCFSEYKPKIGYCQSLNFIAALLLIFMDEEKAFWMLVLITEKYLPGIHDFNLEGVNIHQGVLMLCLRQYLPHVWEIITKDLDLQENDNSFLYELPPLSFCTTSWFMSVFIGVLPIETTLRVWDVLFYDDSKTIFQISLTIFKLLQPKMLHLIHNKHTEDEFLSAELFQIIQNSPKSLIDCNYMMTECFRSSNFNKLKQEEILKCEKFVEENRARYNDLIKKRSKVGLSETERKQLYKSSLDSGGNSGLDKRKIGLKALNWNGRLNNRMKKLKVGGKNI